MTKLNKAKKAALKKAEKKNEIAEVSKLAAEPFTDSSSLTKFAELPISQKTRNGLLAGNFVEMTDIQRMSLGFGLAGRDILGAAKTGSGKTLAFVIPVVENLYKRKWGTSDGLGALIISPTRELALQIFSVLRKVGKFHTLSAGLIIGGKDYDFEKERIDRMNILVCTPGRLLQHMDENAGFDCTNLQVLVLDEADRILDLGFKKSINAIVENLPKERQTMLFSATQTKSVRDLARLSLKDPEYVAVHERAMHSTPEKLEQNYLVCSLYEKLDVLHSFLRTHLKCKILVFVSSCKQVRFLYESFCKLQPGIMIMSLHGKQKQIKRNAMFEKFCRTPAAAMFCTDIAARGLDFPAVDWVIQLDCPEDGATYIHRVGRTARFNASGHSLLFLAPSEEQGMLKVFENQKIPISKIAVNPAKTNTIIPQLEGLCAQYPEIKYLGEKSFICYVRSVWLQKNKEVFDVSKLPLEEYATSLGLPSVPKIKFKQNKAKKNESRTVAEKVAAESDDDIAESKAAASDSESDVAAVPKQVVRTKVEKMFNKKNQDVLSSTFEKLKERDSHSEDEFMILARKDHGLENIDPDAPGFKDRPLSVRDKRKIKARPLLQESNTQITFDDDGKPHLKWALETEGSFLNDEENVFTKHQKYIKAVTEVMQEADVEDKQVQKERLRERKRKLKEKRKGLQPVDDDAGGVVLDTYESQSENEQENERDLTERTDDEASGEELRSFYASSSDNDDEDLGPKRKFPEQPTEKSARVKMSLKDEEELALRLLGGNR